MLIEVPGNAWAIALQYDRWLYQTINNHREHVCVCLINVHRIEIRPVDARRATFAKCMVGKLLNSLPVTQVILVTATEPGEMALESFCESRLMPR